MSVPRYPACKPSGVESLAAESFQHHCPAIQKAGFPGWRAMKTTLDLPDHLIQQVKQRALQQGRLIKELVADYIRQGLHGHGAGGLHRILRPPPSTLPAPRHGAVFRGLNRPKAWNGVDRRPLPRLHWQQGRGGWSAELIADSHNG